jgi:hypothetical protein
VTPLARQRAAFHKNGRADARAVVDGKFFDIEDDTVLKAHVGSNEL